MRAPSRLRVHVATGATALDAVDLALPGPMPLVLARRYRSDSAREGALGPGWELGFEAALEVGEAAVVCHGGPFDGAAFAPVDVGRAARQEATGLVFEHLPDAFVLSATPRRALVFLKRHAQGGRFPLSAVRAGGGQAVQIERRGGGVRIEAVTEPSGRSLRFAYGGERLEAVDLTGPGGTVPVARYAYTGGRLCSVAGPDGRSEHFETSDTWMTAHQTRDGGRTYAQYDGAGRCLALWTDAGEVVHVAYDPARQTTRVVDAAGEQTLYRHVVGRQVLERIAHGGASRTYNYDEAGRLIGHGDAAGVRTFQRLDPADGRLAHLESEERIAFVGYGEVGLAATVEDAFENVSALTWDEAHAVTALTTPDGERWAFERDGLGRVTTVTSPEERIVRLEWAASGLTVADTEGTCWRETWDVLGRMVERVDRTGRRQRRTHGADGHLAEVRFESGYAVEFLHDADGRLVSVADTERRRVRLDRDAAGRIRAVSGSEAQAVAFATDAAGRITSVTADGLAPVHLHRDKHGRLEAITGGFEAAYSYDGRTTTVTDAEGSRRYSFAGDLVERTDASGEREAFVYGPSGEVMSWERTTLEASDGAARSETLLFEHDAAGRLGGVSGQLAHGDRLIDVEVRLERDRDGCLTAINGADGQSIRLTLDASGRPVEIEGAPVRLGYDGAGRLTQVEADGPPVEIATDDLDRPVAVRHGADVTDLRTDAAVVWDERLGGATHESDEAPEMWVSLRAERLGVGLFAHVGPLAVPLLVVADVRCPAVDAAARCVAVAVRGTAGAFAPLPDAEGEVAVWEADPHRDLRDDHTAIPRSRDVGLPGSPLDAFALDPAHLEALPVVAGELPGHQHDPSRDATDAVTGPHREGRLRPAPWRSRSIQTLLPATDLLAPDGSLTASDVLAFLRRRG